MVKDKMEPSAIGRDATKQVEDVGLRQLECRNGTQWYFPRVVPRQLSQQHTNRPIKGDRTRTAGPVSLHHGRQRSEAP
jgi:hypothetical protein